ncbi:sugar-binding protein [Metabacillus litoralis]|uniref:sugar-binding protein n=1 Tax=Metabacillus litoralis TaxID=152268 RepID=UPI00203C57D4|nr:sugar-binding protein [Metabacillus litoralis]MCM3163774.1 sugar-binding protein [Metabacillus litoralis]MCM3409908.1 sugar-binding protein [Metabacillus litoralis]
MLYFRRFLYIITFLVFLLTGFLTLYYGKETFHFNEETKPSAEKTYDYHFVLIPEELDNDYWRLVEQGARDAAKFHNVYLEYLGPKQANNDEYLKTIDMAIAGLVDGVITQGVAEPEFDKLVTKSREKLIPVVTIDTDAPESGRAVYVGTDNYYSGFLAGKALLNDTKGEQKVAIVTGRLEAPHQKLRVQGFKDAVATEKRIEIVAIEESNITEIGAQEAAHRILQQHPKTTAFYGTSALDGIGIAKVVKRVKAEEDLYIIGFDILQETLDYIEEGTIEATVVQFPYQMGYEAVEKMIQLNKGEKMDPLQHTDTKVIYKEDLPISPSSMNGGSKP